MKKHYFGLLAAVGMAVTLALPQETFAARKIWLERQQQEQAYVSTISPADPEAQEILALLQIELQATDPVWSDQDFIALVTKYKDIRRQGIDLIGEAAELVLQAFELDELGERIDDERFQDAFALNEYERQQQEELKAYIKENIEAFKQDPDAFLEGFLNSFQGYEDEYFYEYDEYAPYAYGYADPYEPVEAGRVVWLYDDSYNPLESEMTVTWRQTYGPDVTWLNTTSTKDVAFIMPDLSGTDSYLAFEVTADNGSGTSTYEVYVEGLVPFQSEVADAYREVMGREISEFDHAYWDELWYQGWPIEQIRAHFELMKQQEAAWQAVG